MNIGEPLSIKPIKNMKVNTRLYNNYKYKFLTSKQISKKPNHVILGKII